MFQNSHKYAMQNECIIQMLSIKMKRIQVIPFRTVISVSKVSVLSPRITLQSEYCGWYECFHGGRAVTRLCIALACISCYMPSCCSLRFNIHALWGSTFLMGNHMTFAAWLTLTGFPYSQSTTQREGKVQVPAMTFSRSKKNEWPQGMVRWHEWSMPAMCPAHR